MRAEVWAPLARDVAIQFGAGSAAEVEQLAPRNGGPQQQSWDGWWIGPDLAHGTDYGFIVDSDGPYPDPRSAWQPHGVHGLSRSFDAAHYAWGDQSWRGVDARGAIVYEAHVGTFTDQGTLDALVDPATGRLRQLRDAGVTLLELMPIAPFPGDRGWGYDGVALYSVHEAYGGPGALQRAVDACHAAGIGVCLDVVYNHLGPSGNYLAPFGPYFTAAHHTPWGEAINLDQPHSEQVRAYIIDNALRWFEDFHVDALRLDAVHELLDDSPRHVLAELSDRVAALAERLGRPLSLIAESDLNDERMVASTSAGGLGMTAQWNDDAHHAIHAYLTGERQGYYEDFGSAECLDKVYREVFWHNGTWSPFRNTNWGKPVAETTDRQRFIAFAANHDQVGNRALGDRPAATLTPGAQAASLALTLLGPFTPMLWMGEEWGATTPFQFFTAHDDPELARAVTEGRQREFGRHGWETLYGGPVTVPDPQAESTFEASKLPAVATLESEGGRIGAWYGEVRDARQLTLREGAWGRHPAGATERSPRVLTMHGPVTVHANLSAAPVDIACSHPLAAFGSVERRAGGVRLAPDSVILELVDGEQHE